MRNPRPQRVTNQLRIIGGQWRGRKLGFPDAPGLRPTGDRVRETLFNWLQPYVNGARCLDAFAGSGALGFEALSRGAKEVVFCETNNAAIRQLRSNLDLLKAENVRLEAMDVSTYLTSANASPFDIVFLDPPFHQHWLSRIPPLLNQGWLAAHALIYVEAESELEEVVFPENWQLKRDKKTGQVRYMLFASA